MPSPRPARRGAPYPSTVGLGDLVPGAPQAPLTVEDLEELMDDPRYWRENDPAVREAVERGFALLFPGDERFDAAGRREIADSPEIVPRSRWLGDPVDTGTARPSLLERAALPAVERAAADPRTDSAVTLAMAPAGAVAAHVARQAAGALPVAAAASSAAGTTAAHFARQAAAAAARAAAGAASGAAAAAPILLTPGNGPLRRELPDGGEVIWAPGDLDATVRRRGADGSMMTERMPLVRMVPGADGYPRAEPTDIGAIFFPGPPAEPVPPTQNPGFPADPPLDPRAQQEGFPAEEATPGIHVRLRDDEAGRPVIEIFPDQSGENTGPNWHESRGSEDGQQKDVDYIRRRFIEKLNDGRIPNEHPHGGRTDNGDDVPERYFKPEHGGRTGSRRSDLTIRVYGVNHDFNVYTANKNGAPIRRERNALDSIEKEHKPYYNSNSSKEGRIMGIPKSKGWDIEKWKAMVDKKLDDLIAEIEKIHR